MIFTEFYTTLPLEMRFALLTGMILFMPKTLKFIWNYFWEHYKVTIERRK